MLLTLKPNHLRRYKDAAILLAKYANADIARSPDFPKMFGTDARNDSDNGDSFRHLAHHEQSTKPKELELQEDLEKLGPTFAKLGALLANRPDLMPSSYRAALVNVEGHSPPIEWTQIKAIIENEIGTTTELAYESLEQTPLSVSALHQSHRATLTDGRNVVVKIQRPGVREEVVDDLQALEELATFCQEHKILPNNIDYMGDLEKFKQITIAELDLRQEAHNLTTLRDNLKDFDKLVLPVPVEKYCTAQLLTRTYLNGKPIQAVESCGLLKVERHRLAEQLFQAYLQSFIDGFINTRFATSQTLITSDGKLAILSSGVVAHISAGMQKKLIALLLAIEGKVTERAVRIIIDLGKKTEHFNRTSLCRAIDDLLPAQREERVEPGTVLQDIARASLTNGLQLPVEVVTLGSILANLDAIVHTLDPHFDTKGFFHRAIDPIVQRRAKESLSPNQFFHTVMEAAEGLEHLPAQVSTILDALANNELKIQIHAIDEQLLMVGFQKVANRITVGLVLAALIVGASMLMRVQTQFTIAGYPGLAILCFLIAAGCGFVLVVEILLSDRKRH